MGIKVKRDAGMIIGDVKSGGGGDLSNYYTKAETDSLVEGVVLNAWRTYDNISLTDSDIRERLSIVEKCYTNNKPCFIKVNNYRGGYTTEYTEAYFRLTGINTSGGTELGTTYAFEYINFLGYNDVSVDTITININNEINPTITTDLKSNVIDSPFMLTAVYRNGGLIITANFDDDTANTLITRYRNNKKCYIKVSGTVNNSDDDYVYLELSEIYTNDNDNTTIFIFTDTEYNENDDELSIGYCIIGYDGTNHVVTRRYYGRMPVLRVGDVGDIVIDYLPIKLHASTDNGIDIFFQQGDGYILAITEDVERGCNIYLQDTSNFNANQSAFVLTETGIYDYEDDTDPDNIISYRNVGFCGLVEDLENGTLMKVRLVLTFDVGNETITNTTYSVTVA